MSKAETVVALGDNAKADIKGRAKELAGVLDEIAELQERAKEIKSEAKLEGYDMKAFGQVVKELRRGAEYQAAQLTLELTLDTYRKAAGVATEIDEAEKAVRKHVEEVPEPKPKGKGKSRRGDLN
jgi:uncharacterized protein (UPF0335 family)